MTGTAANSSSRIERVRLLVARVGYVISTVLLVAGLAAALSGQAVAARRAFTAAVTLLAILPLTGVVALMSEEIRRRDWGFALIAAGVVALLADSLVRLFLAAD